VFQRFEGLNDLELLKLRLKGLIRHGQEDRNANAFVSALVYSLEKKRPVDKFRIMLCMVDYVILIDLSLYMLQMNGELSQ
jgi:hypothetical protein